MYDPGVKCATCDTFSLHTLTRRGAGLVDKPSASITERLQRPAKLDKYVTVTGRCQARVILQNTCANDSERQCAAFRRDIGLANAT